MRKKPFLSLVTTYFFFFFLLWDFSYHIVFVSWVSDFQRHMTKTIQPVVEVTPNASEPIAPVKFRARLSLSAKTQCTQHSGFGRCVYRLSVYI